MIPPASNSRLGPEFDAFLFAPLGEDRNGLPLSMVSLLARMDLDPWKEAACLADLPAEAAARKLALLLIGQPVASSTQADPDRSATRLIALLPRRTSLEVRSLEIVRAGSFAHPRVIMHAVVFAIWLIWLLGLLQTFFARHDPPAHADIARTTAPLTVPLQPAPTSSGR